ncbi:hypothetical protein CD351_00160 [Erythrobacter sp. KY5]|uniref:TM0106 family RecB-like putative nuclease n=1 Tax=Erythrobacter sp. KY5 TaxID=2011159 RepID=UPI000DBF2DEB|nr:TM0106 family RecB-like putative nuclease [Erythrobacter sp. KY5]AWW72833.1 hypothetical protein CD351_00160 [Erythrobacter sp. KY5]
MQRIDGEIRLSASDLMRFQGCRHATTMDLAYLNGEGPSPKADDPEAQLLQEQGDRHELDFLERLKREGTNVVEIETNDRPIAECVDATITAMRSGADVVFQGAILGEQWGGYSDFLERVDRPSQLGDWSYEVVDTKLKRQPDPKHVLQLCLYSDLLADMQGVHPELAHLELGDGSRFSVCLSEVSAYARRARSRLESFINEGPETHPEPVPACSLCRWASHCRSVWEEENSLALVAGMTRSQRDKARADGVKTMKELAVHDRRIPRLAKETQARLQVQAKLQQQRRDGGEPTFELRDPVVGRGFDLLPEPDEGDVFYDIEGDPFYPGGGLEYLHGLWFRDNDQWHFRAFWAHNREEEGDAARQLVDFLSERMARYPNAHIYHYANYEIAALRKLTSVHRTREAPLDQLQRERRFVDLYRIVSGAMVVSEDGYSIKDLEAFYMEKRDAEVSTAGASVVFYEQWRNDQDDTLLEKIEDYNRTDCISTQLLLDWLVSAVRPDRPWPKLGDAPSDAADQKVAEHQQEDEDLKRRLEPLAQNLGEPVATLLFDLSRFHEREDKPAYWAIFDRLSQESEELRDDLDCLQGLEAIGAAEKVTARSVERTYRFPEQETKLREGKRPCIKPESMPEDVGITALDMKQRTVTIRRSSSKPPLPDTLDLIPPRPFQNKILRNAIMDVIDRLIANDPALSAVRTLLTKSLPELTGRAEGSQIIAPDNEVVESSSQAIQAMNDTTIAIQGPPGTGKTYVSANAIVDLCASGQRVAVSSNSHRAIGNLLVAVAQRAREKGKNFNIVQKVSSPPDGPDDPMITVVTDNKAGEIGNAHIVGSTAWHFARYDDMPFDHLMIDEAGQVSLANVLAMARCAKNICLVGDPMQLPQPLQGAHPGESSLSSLEYLIGQYRVVPQERGIFLPVSRRMGSEICDFISTAVYEGKLTNDAGAAAQSLLSTDGNDLSGAILTSVEHRGCTQVSHEEIARIQEKVGSLVGATYVNREGKSRVIAHEDILVVAPYNAQVNQLREQLDPQVRVGTVDLFQGQEGPICLVSMTTSSGAEIPRGIDFLFSINRLNVAISRAQARAEVIANPALLDIKVGSVDEMKLVNTLCLLAERFETRPL